MIPAFPAHDFPQLLDIRKGHLAPGPGLLDSPDQDAGPSSATAIDANDVALHGSPVHVCGRLAKMNRRCSPDTFVIRLQQSRGEPHGWHTDSEEE
jgi:hypothetical protein